VVENDIMVLIGHLGAGKTTGVMKVAEMCNAPLAVINCDGQLTVEQVIGTRVPVLENGVPTLAWRDAPLLEAYRKGYWAVIDDYTFTGSDVFSAIFGLMTNSQYQVLVTGEIIPRHENFRLFLTTNPPEYIELYPNRQQPDAAFLSRIQARYWVDFLPAAAERKAMQEAAPVLPSDTLDRMQKVIEVSRNMLKQGSINFVFSTRHAVNWAKKVARSGKLQQAAFEAFVADMDQESKSVMQSKILDAVTD
jgi:MoxR-like ATPase